MDFQASEHLAKQLALLYGSDQLPSRDGTCALQPTTTLQSPQSGRKLSFMSFLTLKEVFLQEMRDSDLHLIAGRSTHINPL